MHAGDTSGTLRGSRLDEVQSLTLKGLVFQAGELTPHPGGEELSMSATDAASSAALKPEHAAEAKVTLKDGRVLSVAATIDEPRPRATLLNSSVRLPASLEASHIALIDPTELPQGAALVFALRSQTPASFGHDEAVEVATADESFTTSLTLANGGLSLENAHVAVATLVPAKAFGPAAFGPLKFRMSVHGLGGEWQPLAHLVRVPMLQSLECPPSADLACKLSGADLYLIDTVADGAQPPKTVEVPDGFVGSALPVPHPASGSLYVRLRDDPAVLDAVTLAPATLPPASPESDRTQVRESTLHATTGSPPVAPASAPTLAPPSAPPATPAGAPASSPASAPASAPPATSSITTP